MSATPVTPRDAASVVLVRETAAGAEALLIRRHAALAFAGGSWVFPGGKLEAADAVRTGSPGDGNAALRVAGCRETFEETGVLLARTHGGEPCPPETVRLLQALRPEISREPARFVTMLDAHGLVPDLAGLVLFSRWVTPAVASIRFDARFFVTGMPDGQVVYCDSAEATEQTWLRLDPAGGLPDESLVPAPPTRYTLADLATSLAGHAGLRPALLAESGREPTPIVPKMIRLDGQVLVLMPWDEEYYSLPGPGTPKDALIPPRYRDYPSRVVPSIDLGAPPLRSSGQP